MTSSFWSPSIVVFVGAVIVAAGTFWSAKRQASFQTTINAKNEEIVQLNIKNSELIQKESLNAITGGDSWFYFETSAEYPTSQNPAKVVTFTGRYPMFDVTVATERLILDLKSKHYSKVNENMVQFGTIHGSTNRLLRGTWDNSVDTDGIYYRIFIESRNGEILQDLYFRKVHGKWTKANKVSRVVRKDNHIENIEELKRQIDPEFPSQELNWN